MQKRYRLRITTKLGFIRDSKEFDSMHELSNYYESVWKDRVEKPRSRYIIDITMKSGSASRDDE